jgi:hypothetical protein
MNTKLKSLIIGGALLAGISGTAAARDNVSFSLSFGVPAYTYVEPYPSAYYAPSAYYYDPPVYYAAPPVVYYNPAPVYYSQPAFGFTVRDGHRYGSRHGHGHNRHNRHR